MIKSFNNYIKSIFFFLFILQINYKHTHTHTQTHTTSTRMMTSIRSFTSALATTTTSTSCYQVRVLSSTSSILATQNNTNFNNDTLSYLSVHKRNIYTCNIKLNQSSSTAAPTATIIKATIPTITKQELQQKIEKMTNNHDSQYVLVDVREKHELKHGVIPSAFNIPLGELDSALQLSDEEFLYRYSFPKLLLNRNNTKVIFYCLAGIRAETAAAIAMQHGIQAVNYRGSFRDWFGRGY